uniref:Uncharacterized protein n=1 Tax=Haptolina brevifila TaxID=156173 RepID=A0A7S2INT3_9EUKA|mmetsp:Transcript_69113/g.137078  ORF Transcript_69113/g.137078 Transcript_69113/m.137078 type:complete len:294 (+) Transcript_69113:91-972(+)
MLPRNGFLQESRSCPVIGPGEGRPLSPRFGKLNFQGPQRNGVGVVGYDLPEVHRYKRMNSAVNTTLGPGFGIPSSRGDVDLVPPGCGAATFYEVPLERANTAPRLGPGPGRPTSPRGCHLVPPGHGADKLYELPPPETYKQPREPQVPRWDPAYKRFPKVPKIGTDTQYTLPHPNVYMKQSGSLIARLGPGSGRVIGPRIDPKQYMLGDGADALYDVTPISVTKPCKTTTAYTFAPPVARKEVGARNPDVPIRILPADAPAWLDRLSTYTPRPKKPWLERSRSTPGLTTKSTG